MYRQSTGTTGGDDHERVRHLSRRHCEPAGADPVLHAVHVKEDHALEHIHRLVRFRVEMQRRHLSLLHAILEEEESAASRSRLTLLSGPLCLCARAEPPPGSAKHSPLSMASCQISSS